MPPPALPHVLPHVPPAVLTTKEYMRIVSEIKPEWLVGAALCSACMWGGPAEAEAEAEALAAAEVGAACAGCCCRTCNRWLHSRRWGDPACAAAEQA